MNHQALTVSAGLAFSGFCVSAFGSAEAATAPLELRYRAPAAE